jgi:hypothetical protein
MSPAAKSYLRHVLIAITPLLTTNDADWRHYAFAVSLAIVGPLIRALDPQDKGFGLTDGDKKEEA